MSQYSLLNIHLYSYIQIYTFLIQLVPGTPALLRNLDLNDTYVSTIVKSRDFSKAQHNSNGYIYINMYIYIKKTFNEKKINFWSNFYSKHLTFMFIKKQTKFCENWKLKNLMSVFCKTCILSSFNFIFIDSTNKVVTFNSDKFFCLLIKYAAWHAKKSCLYNIHIKIRMDHTWG